MAEKSIEPKQEVPNEEKKVYTPPTLTVYGKLTELTASGAVSRQENVGHPEGKL